MKRAAERRATDICPWSSQFLHVALKSRLRAVNFSPIRLRDTLGRVRKLWQHSRAVIAEVLGDKYVDLLRAGWECTGEEIQRDVEGLFGGEFARFCRASG